MTIGTVYILLRKVLTVQGKPGGTVQISNGMPDVEALMQQWPISYNVNRYCIYVNA